jgi:hypothetical protein
MRAIRDVTLVAPQELPSVIEHIRSLGAMYEENDKSLAALYAGRALTSLRKNARSTGASTRTGRAVRP